MPRRIVLAVTTVLTLLLVGSIWYLRSPGERMPADADVKPAAGDDAMVSELGVRAGSDGVGAEPASTPARPALARGELGRLRADELVAIFTSAQSAAGLDEVINKLETKDHAKAVELRILVEAMCSANSEDDPRTAELPTSTAIYAALARFCQGYPATPTSTAHHFGQFQDGYLLNAGKQLNEIRLAQGAEQAMAQAQSNALGARDRLEWEAAAIHLRGSESRGEWLFGRDDVEIQADPSNAIAIQQLALELYGCRIFSDCAGRPLRWYTHCIRTLMCAPSESYLDVLRNTHTPRQYAAAERLAAELMRMRMSGKH
jgi:hypothetical protein